MRDSLLLCSIIIALWLAPSALASGDATPMAWPTMLASNPPPGEVGSWVIAASLMVSVITGLLAIVSFFRPQPALHKQFADREETKESLKDIKASLEEIDSKIDRFSGDQYKARGRLHRSVNRLENAMHFWAGKLAGAGDQDAAQLKRLLERSIEGENE